MRTPVQAPANARAKRLASSTKSRTGRFGEKRSGDGSPDGFVSAKGLLFSESPAEMLAPCASREKGQDSADGLGVYLRQVAVFRRLTRDEEVQLAGVIRSGFGAFLEQMVAAGSVQEWLLETGRALLLAAPKQAGRLREAVDVAGEVFEQCGGLFALDCGIPESERVRSREAFLALFSATELHPSRCLERLREMSLEWNRLRKNQKPDCEASQRALREYAAKNRMSAGAFERFLSSARGLESVVLGARNRLVDANLKLVVKQAQKLSHGTLPLMDLIQEGNLGLLLAAERFDERLGWRFSTLATCMIKNTMLRAIDNSGRTVRLPVHQCEQLRKLDRALLRLEGRMSRAPLPSEVAHETGLSEERVRALLCLRQVTVSLEEPATPGSGFSVAESLGDCSSLSQIYGGAHGLEWVEEYLENVPEPERSVLTLRFGLSGSEPLEASAVARRLGLTRQGVARLERSGLSKLRSRIGAGRKRNQVAA